MPSLRGTYRESGAIVDVQIGVSEPRRKALLAGGLSVPPMVSLSLLLDTGADTTMLDEQVMRTLAIPERGAREVVGSTTHIEPTTWSTYDISFCLQAHREVPWTIPAIEVLAKPFFHASIDGLIGRDILDRIELTIGKGRYHLQY